MRIKVAESAKNVKNFTEAIENQQLTPPVKKLVNKGIKIRAGKKQPKR